jgi:hypothetical protein
MYTTGQEASWTMLREAWKLRLFASVDVISKAEEVMQSIAETYNLPNRDLRNLQEMQEQDVDVLRAFSEACREDLRV